MVLLGIDIGTSSMKVSVADAETQHCFASAQYPETESGIMSFMAIGNYVRKTFAIAELWNNITFKTSSSSC